MSSCAWAEGAVRMSTDVTTNADSSHRLDLHGIETGVEESVPAGTGLFRSRLLQARTIVSEARLLAQIENDLGVLAAQAGNTKEALECFGLALEHRPRWPVPEENIRCLKRRVPANTSPTTVRTRIAIISLLFNWPSRGGGTVHTAETARFLTRAGYDIRHFSIRYDPWGLGKIREPADWPLQELAFAAAEWNRAAIEQRVREAMDGFQPDAVIVTDSWSMKPRLAEALSGYRVFLRLAAQECLCPLNNVRLLSIQPPNSCPRQQLANPEFCRDCVQQREQLSGNLHQAERQLAGFYERDYPESVRRAFARAAGVLVVNPLIAEMVKPFAQQARVIPSGFDPNRFPWTEFEEDGRPEDDPPVLLFAGLVEEPMKGFEVLRIACGILRKEGRRFRLLVTADAGGLQEESIEYIGWQSQNDLPSRMRDADIVVCPTIAEEALGRTAVEAMGAWRPVVASRFGGLPFTVLDEATGLLCEPGDPVDLARQLARLIDDPDLRRRMGTLGRQRFESHYTWDVILKRHYLPLLGPPVVAGNADRGIGIAPQPVKME